MTNHFVIMAGGQGTRLYPLSTAEKPKQFLDLLGSGKTLIQMTYERFKAVDPDGYFWVVTSKDYIHWIKEQLPAIPDDQILAEPVPRNTAPCISYAIWKIKARFGQCNIVVSPSDAFVSSIDSFAVTIKKALKFTGSGKPSVVCVGIKPSNPNTGYGYIEISSLDEMQTIDNEPDIIKVKSFREKPDLETAKRYLKAGNYFWNAGIFVWSTLSVETEIPTHAPRIAAVMDALEPSFYTPSEEAALAELFPTCEKISIDYAVMEKSSHVWCIPADWPWDDLGSFASIEKITGRTVPEEIKKAQEEYQRLKQK
jgi:mannose-1-phosphate guanylyltransferase